MPVLDRSDLQQEPTVPDNLDQRVRFGSITDIVKDVFVWELRHFFNTANNDLRLNELPRIDKYAVAVDPTVDPLETTITLVRSYPDVIEKLPTIAVLSTTGRNTKLSFSTKFTSVVVPPAKLIASNVGQYALSDGMSLEISTIPSGVSTDVVQSLFKFPAFMFANIAQATPEEVASVINIQAKYCTAYVTGTGTSKAVAIRAGGTHGTSFPNKITIVGGTALSALGFTIGQTDQNYGSGHITYERHHMAADLSVSMEVVAESETIRAEISDLLYDFFAYTMADRKFQFYGRSTFDDTVLDETYQIILKDNEFSFSGEQETPRLNDMRDKLYINRISIPVTAILYSDRVVVDSNNDPYVPQSYQLITTDDLPEPN